MENEILKFAWNKVDDIKDHIEKYLKGELSPAEMHKLEMKALDDPFLAEALEGAEMLDAELFVNDVDSINKKIQSRNKTKYYWPIRIAASLLLLISVTYVVFRTAPENTTKQLALQKNTKAADEIHPIISDTITNTKKIPENLLSLKIEEKPTGDIKPKVEIDIEDKSAEADEEIKKEPIVEATQPLQLASESEMVSEPELTTELDEINKEQIAESKTARQRTRSEAFKKSAAASPTSGLSADKQDDIETKTDIPQPSVGMADYQKYLKDNVVYPKTAIENNIGGEVTISFMVNRNATLSDFVVEKGIGHGCDEELIRLIKSGPVWVPAVKNNTSVNQKTSLSFEFDIRK